MTRGVKREFTFSYLGWEKKKKDQKIMGKSQWHIRNSRILEKEEVHKGKDDFGVRRALGGGGLSAW